jgi:Spy/CpxP family protein refolding chaperone
MVASAVAFAQAPNGAPEPGGGPNAGVEAAEMQAPPPDPGGMGPGGGPGGMRGMGPQGMRGQFGGARGERRGAGPMGPMMGMRGPMGPGRIEALKSYLKLSDEQVKSIQGLIEERGKKFQATRHQVGAKQQALMQSLHQPAGDANAPKQALEDLQTARQQMQAVEKEFQEKLAGVLKPEQLAQLKELEKAAEMQRAIHEAGALGLIKGAQPFGGERPPMMPPHAPPAPIE